MSNDHTNPNTNPSTRRRCISISESVTVDGAIDTLYKFRVHWLVTVSYD